MKIAIDCRMWMKSGIGVYLRGILPHLISKGINDNFLLIGNKKELSDFFRYNNVKVFDCEIQPFSFRELYFFPVKGINSCDLYYTPNFNLPGGVSIPKIVTIHDLLFFDYPEIVNRLGILIRQYYMKRAFHSSEKIITVSNFTKQRIVKFLGSNKEIIIVYNGISEYLIKNREKIVKSQSIIMGDYILYIGNIKRHKNLGLMLEAFFLAKERGFSKRLVIIGNFKGLKSIDKKTRNLILNEAYTKRDVLFLSNVDDYKLANIVYHAQALIMPSLYEGFGLPPLEALFLQTPVVLSDIPVFREIYSKYPVVFFDPIDKYDLAEKMLNLRYKKLSKEVVDKIKNSDFNFSIAADKLRTQFYKLGKGRHLC